ncbi:hypothetical protein NDU88_003839 [Pleurodeles waltl]|uniref:Uncharacterized protein n=1 Tax=Pleurodeles waltl TaxID=8319 RepID=A0AAV7T602_PLEWA|nr:hypothetical protein NDU88_003839 [Pleurodeles waltl]
MRPQPGSPAVDQIFCEESWGSNAPPGPRALANHPPPRVAPSTPIPGVCLQLGSSRPPLSLQGDPPCLGAGRRLARAPRLQVSSHLDFQELLIGPAGFGPSEKLSREPECVCVGGDEAATRSPVQHRVSPPTCVGPSQGRAARSGMAGPAPLRLPAARSVLQ